MLIHWIWLAQLTGVTVSQKLELLRLFRDPEEIYKADPAAVSAASLTPKAQQSLQNRDLHEARRILSDCGEKNISILTFGDAAYPAKLKNMAQPPLVLYYKGCLPDWENVPVIGIVGTRKASPYGLHTAKQLGGQIAACGALVVSGGADGIDTQALEGALQAQKKVVAVLGFGADVVYPAKNKELFAKVEKQGCLLTEFVPGTPPNGWNFPQRNRIISGISAGIVVVEAPERSGALNTARHALDQCRDVYVVPGNVDNDSCAGSNQLLREGATPVFTGWDVVREYEGLYPGFIRRIELSSGDAPLKNNPILPVIKAKPDNKSIDNRDKSRYSVEDNKNRNLTPEEEKVLSLVTREPVLVDQIIDAAGLPAGKVLSVLTMLTMKGLVQNHPGKYLSLK